MITRAQVQDLRPGDVVDYRRDDWPEGAFVRSPLNSTDLDAALYVLDGQFGVRTHDGGPYEHMATLTVVSRAKPPLYVNHPRTEPVPGDVAADWEAPNDYEPLILLRTAGQRFPAKWIDQFGMERTYNSPTRLRLLVDGETGQVVR